MRPCSGPIDVHDALPRIAAAEERDAPLARVRAISVSTIAADLGVGDAAAPGEVGT